MHALTKYTKTTRGKYTKVHTIHITATKIIRLKNMFAFFSAFCVVLLCFDGFVFVVAIFVVRQLKKHKTIFVVFFSIHLVSYSQKVNMYMYFSFRIVRCLLYVCVCVICVITIIEIVCRYRFCVVASTFFFVSIY